MKKRDDIEKRTEELITPILERLGFSLYDTEYVKEGADFYLRAYIDKEGGITVNDCEEVSREMNEILDRENYVEGSYIFEVSSPGLGRKLTKDKHLAKSIGQEVELKLFQAVNKEKEFCGILERFDQDTVTIRLEDEQKLTLERQGIAMIRLALDF